MYYDPRLDTPPPASQFRRPWSPDPYEPLPSNRIQQTQYDVYEYDHVQGFPQLPHVGSRRQRREGSDVSVEALDLADYAQTLRARQADDTYPAFHPYPPSPLRVLASRDSLQPPSLISRGETLSSNTYSSSPPTRNHTRRPYSLPPSSRNASTTSRPPNRSPYLADPHISHDPEIDISRFPAWSRSWYAANIADIAPLSPPDIYTALPTSQFGPAAKRSPFDPGYIRNDRLSDRYSSDPYSYVPPSSMGHDSARDLLPWSSDPPDYGLPVDSTLKEERIRMLEREFGPNGKDKGPTSARGTGLDFVDEHGKPLIGTVNDKGSLVTQGPRKRTAVRILQILLALAASVPSIYAALIIKPKEAPPPSGKPAAFALYILSVITLLLLLYLFVFRPCCCAGKRTKGLSNNPLANGMMVLPVQGLGGEKAKKKRRRKGKTGKGGGVGGQGDVQVNLIVDPNVFGRGEEESDEDEAESAPGAYEVGRRKKKPRRRGVFAGLAMEEEWKRARAWAKKLAVVDVAGLVVWGAVFIFILVGKRCPSGGFEGWCNAYNVSSAAACLLCVGFGVSVFFDIKDLHASKASPRTRA